jgi:hypothetical protein
MRQGLGSAHQAWRRRFLSGNGKTGADEQRQSDGK